MILRKHEIFTRNGIKVDVYGETGNNSFETEAISMLYDVGKFINYSDILNHINEEKGTVVGSDYIKKILGNVNTVGCPKPEVCKVQHVTIGKGGVKEHPHPEGELYLIPFGNEGILTLGGEPNPLREECFYNIPPNVDHGLAPVMDLRNEMEVLVFKFSPDVLENFDASIHALSLTLTGLDKPQ